MLRGDLQVCSSCPHKLVLPFLAVCLGTGNLSLSLCSRLRWDPVLEVKRLGMGLALRNIQPVHHHQLLCGLASGQV